MVAASVSLESLCVNSIRMLAVDAVNKSNSGHPGLPMGCAPMGYALWQNILNHNPNNPKWFNRDRFVLSAGHESALIYSILTQLGWLNMEDIQNFRQLHSRTPGHPEVEIPGIEATTGPLGQGFGMAVGMATAESMLRSRVGELIDHFTYVVAGDGDFLSIGAEHIAPQAKRNLDVCVVIMDNAVYGLTKGQSSPTSEEGMITSSTPYGKTEQGFDPLAYYLSLGISFVASGLSSKIKDLSELIYEGMIHPGFSIVHVQSPCTEYNNTYEKI